MSASAFAAIARRVLPPLACVAVACAALAPLATRAHAQEGTPARVLIGNVRMAGGHRQTAWVSVLDGEGVPVSGLASQQFAVENDGHEVEEFELTTFRKAFDSFRLTVLVDPELTRGETGEALKSMLRSLAPLAAEHDRLRLETLADAPRTADGRLDQAADVARDLDQLASGETSSRLWDGLYRVVRDAARRPDNESRAVLLITRGVESGSGHNPLDVLAVSNLNGRPVPIGALVVGDGGEVDKLSRLVARTGGVVRKLDKSADLPNTGAALIRRLVGAYRLTYRVSDWDAHLEQHVLTVTVQGAAGPRQSKLEYAAADVLGPPWWRRPLLWVILGALLLAAVVAGLVLRRSRLCRLVVASGEEKGCSYEIYGLPVTLGAAVGNDLTFPEQRVSRNHAVLERRGSGIELVDLNSENGTFVNGERITRRRLVKGDRIRIGGMVELQYEGKS